MIKPHIFIVKRVDKKLVKGRSIQGVVAACVYAACRDTETPRTLDNVADGINIRRKDVAQDVTD